MSATRFLAGNAITSERFVTRTPYIFGNHFPIFTGDIVNEVYRRTSAAKSVTTTQHLHEDDQDQCSLMLSQPCDPKGTQQKLKRAKESKFGKILPTNITNVSCCTR
jgi:hypothetical protein